MLHTHSGKLQWWPVALGSSSVCLVSISYTKQSQRAALHKDDDVDNDDYMTTTK